MIANQLEVIRLVRFNSILYDHLVERCIILLQDIAEIAKFYELLLQGLDQRMNVENVKRSGRHRKGVPDIEPRREEIDTRY